MEQDEVKSLKERKKNVEFNLGIPIVVVITKVRNEVTKLTSRMILR
jgi:hypothetical protein